MNNKRSFEGQTFSTNHIHRAKNNNNNRNWFDINLDIKEILYHYVASCKIDPFQESGDNLGDNPILDVFISLPRRFQVMEIFHFSSVVGGDRSKFVKSIIRRYFIIFSIFISHAPYMQPPLWWLHFFATDMPQI
jgi:hypothetical protein